MSISRWMNILPFHQALVYPHSLASSWLNWVIKACEASKVEMVPSVQLVCGPASQGSPIPWSQTDTCLKRWWQAAGKWPGQPFKQVSVYMASVNSLLFIYCLSKDHWNRCCHVHLFCSNATFFHQWRPLNHKNTLQFGRALFRQVKSQLEP